MLQFCHLVMQCILSRYKFLSLPRRVFVCVCVSVCATSFAFTTHHPPPPQPQRGRDPVELLCAGCYVELQDSVDLGLAWAAEVEENVGGRLKLRLVGTEGLPDTPATLWLFYLHPRLHPPGWAKEHGCALRPPSGQSRWHGVRFLYLETKRRKEKMISRSQGLLPQHAWLIVCDGKTHEEFSGQSYTGFPSSYLSDLIISLLVVRKIIKSHVYSYSLNQICHFPSFVTFCELYNNFRSVLCLVMKYKQPIFKMCWYPTRPWNWFSLQD